MNDREEKEYAYERLRRARRRAKRRRMVMLRRALVASVAILLLTFVCFLVFVITRVDRTLTIEAGETVTAEMFRHYDWDGGTIYFVTEPESTTHVGEYSCKVFATLFNYKVTLQVQDRTAPSGKGIRVIGTYGELPSAEQFVTDIKDAAECSITWAAEPDVTKYGLQTVKLLLTDQAGNKTEVAAELMIPNAKTSLTIEAGSKTPTAEQFLISDNGQISIVSGMEFDTNTVGNYPVVLMADGMEVEATVFVVDTTPPSVTAKNVTTYLNKEKTAEQFISQIEDKSEVQISYLTEPDWSIEGSQTVTLLAVDTFGNQTEVQAKLTIQRDTEKPDIQVSDIDVVIGSNISYKKAANYCDNIDTKEELTLIVDRAAVDTSKVGTYTVTYIVTDCSGNSASATGKVNVLAEEPLWADEAKIHAKADEILASILTDDMTLKEKAKKIYRWIKNNVGYISHSEKGDYMRGAYEGLFKKQGDCFVYASTAKELLTRAGIENMDIVKGTVNPSHYWNLVNLGEGWYHFDTTPRKDKSEFFLLTDAELEAYSVAHKDSHNFDRSLYPQIQ